ncbi:MAG: succinate dehydrogenase, partial [Candidatus Binatia bacterium]
MATAGIPVPRRRFGETARRDLWWLQPLAVFTVFGSFVLYTTWASFQGEHYHYGPYLSPFYSPELFGDSEHAWLGPSPAWWPAFLPYSPAFLILAIPAGFRVTCYYYRGAYYKAFWADPPSCTVGEPRSSYWGERSFPLVIQNLHRYFLYGALLYLPILSWDVWKALWFPDPATGEASFGIGVGTLVLAANTVLLAGYTFGCHSLRHLVGGRWDRISESPLRKNLYACAGCFNRRHMVWAWSSLVSVGFADLYVRLCSMGV